MIHLGQNSMAPADNDDLKCKPLDSLEEIVHYAENPPSWRSLCKELQPHSKMKIRNIDVNKYSGSISLDCPQTFCHLDPDAEDVQRHHEKSLPKTLVCHDMANGYHDDSYIDGTGQHDAYTFYNWAGIDIFCYFSHHLVTIPPLGWINVGHAHGVKVIGTLITEWSEGVKFWDQVLATEEGYQKLANALVAIAKSLKFDGWLLNVENKISKPSELLQFVRYLHGALHHELVEPVLIWYDSVTVDGHLIWQNKLNEKNKDFFEACDGLFTNYSWSESDVAESAAAAGDRLADLYVGLDVWGRNFYGGGQFNVQEAVQVAHTHGCSLAIFAPAWTHEGIGAENTVFLSDDLTHYDRFLLRDRALWGSVWPYLSTRLPSALPFHTSFCKGQGVKRWLYGEVFCPVPWYNLRHMQYQPNSAHGPHGYLLSTRDNIIHVSQHGILRDDDGGVRYEKTFQLSRLMLHSVTVRDVDKICMSELDAEGVEADDGPSYEVKRKMKDAFNYLFRTKADKVKGEPRGGRKALMDANADIGVDDIAVEPCAASERDNSLEHVSVNVKVNQHKKKTRYALVYVPDEAECLEQYTRDGFIGGSCLKINPADKLSPEHRTTRLFHSDFYCKDSLIICVVTKTFQEFKDQSLNIILHCWNSEERAVRVVLVGQSRELSTPAGGADSVPVYPVAGPAFRDLQKYLLLNQPDCYISIENSYGWIVRYYSVSLPAGRVSSVSCRAALSGGPMLLGYLGICHAEQSSECVLPSSEVDSPPSVVTSSTLSTRGRESRSIIEQVRSKETRKRSASDAVHTVNEQQQTVART